MSGSVPSRGPSLFASSPQFQPGRRVFRDLRRNGCPAELITPDVRRALEWLNFLGLMAIMFAVCPVFVGFDLIARARIRRILRGTAADYAFRFHVADDHLAIGPIDRVPLSAITQVEIWEIVGDAGFAAANSITYLLALTIDGSRRCFWHTIDPREFYRALAVLRARGVVRVEGRVDGLLRGLSTSLVYAFTVCWILVLVLH